MKKWETARSSIEKMDAEILEEYFIDKYYIAKTLESTGKIRYRGYLEINERILGLRRLHASLESCLIECVACFAENSTMSRATFYIMKMLGLEE